MYLVEDLRIELSFIGYQPNAHTCRLALKIGGLGGNRTHFALGKSQLHRADLSPTRLVLPPRIELSSDAYKATASPSML